MNCPCKPSQCIKVKPLHADAKLPTQSYEDGAYDFYAVGTTYICPGHTEVIPLGVAVEFPPGHKAFLWDRSGMGKRGLHRFAGCIEPSYRGEWKVVLYNATPNTQAIIKGDRVIQAVFQRVETWPVVLADQLSETERGAGGFGSSGK